MQPEMTWFVGVGGQQQGPMPTSQVVAGIQAGTINAEAFVFTQGMANWTPIKTVQPFSAYFGAPGMPPSPPPAAVPPVRPDELDFQIFGEEMQFVEVVLDAGEAAVSEAGAMYWMDAGITMESMFGDGTGRPDETLLDKAKAVGSRVLTGESIAMTLFRNPTQQKQKIAFAAPYPGKIIPLDLRQHGGKVICQKDSFLAAARGIKIGIELQKNLGVGLFGGEGFILQKLEGDGLVFTHAGGCVTSRTLAAGEMIKLDTGCLVAFHPTVKYDVQLVGGIANTLFGGEGLFLATLTGPGTIWTQSLPFSRLAGRIYAAAPQTGGTRGDEGSILGRAGDIAMGSGGPAVPNVDIGNVLGAVSRLIR